MTTTERRERIARVLARRRRDVTLVVNNVHDPHNVSAMLRSCDAFGVSEIHLLYTREAFPNLGRRSSASAKKWIDLHRHTSAASVVSACVERGMTLVTTGFGEQATPLHEWDFTRPTAVVVGNEHRGVEPELAASAEAEIKIPMQGMVRSLNVSVAAAVILYEAWRQRETAGADEASALPVEEQARLAREWAKR